MNYKILYDRSVENLQSLNTQKIMTIQDRNVLEYACRYYCEGYRNDNNSKSQMYNNLKNICE